MCKEEDGRQIERGLGESKLQEDVSWKKFDYERDSLLVIIF